MSWGIRITILYLSFVALIVGLVSMSMHEKIDLEMKDYYAQEIKYQDRINAIERTNRLQQPLSWQITGREIVFRFPSELKGQVTKGNILFFRPSDASMDKTVAIPADTSQGRHISVEYLKKGFYKMKIEWQAGNETYYNEGTINIH